MNSSFVLLEKKKNKKTRRVYVLTRTRRTRGIFPIVRIRDDQAIVACIDRRLILDHRACKNEQDGKFLIDDFFLLNVLTSKQQSSGISTLDRFYRNHFNGQRE